MPESLSVSEFAPPWQQTRRRPDWEFSHDSAFELLCRQFQTQDLQGFGIRCRTSWHRWRPAGVLPIY